MKTDTNKMSNINTAGILVTGGAGFIGSNFIRFVLNQDDFCGKIVNYDKLTYAGNLANLDDIANREKERYAFCRGDICDTALLESVIRDYDINVVVHFAAESHVDRSIHGPDDFIETNITGTFRLLETVRKHAMPDRKIRFHHISTDEVYGSLGPEGYFYETTPYDPRSPYSASKAASDHLVRSYHHTYGLPITVSNCSNNYGPFHFPEKLIPLMILNAIEGKPLPIYGDGKNVRDWLYVMDHCDAIWMILKSGRVSETYNIGGECEKQNIEVVTAICEILEELLPPQKNIFLLDKKIKAYKDLIKYVADRPGHDRRYAINCDKIKKELGWYHRHSFESGLRETVQWYLDHKDWIDGIRSGSYMSWIEKNYTKRLTENASTRGDK